MATVSDRHSFKYEKLHGGGTDSMKAAMRAYIDRFNAGDLEGGLEPHAETANDEDSVGTPVHRSRDALRRLYAEVARPRGIRNWWQPCAIRGAMPPPWRSTSR